jgi:hypothetical protein
MSRTPPRLNPLELRKELLIAESEINRVQLAEEWNAMTAGFHNVTERVKSVGSIASVAVMLLAGVSAFRRRKSESNGAKNSLFRTALKGAEIAGSVWQAWRARKN